MIRELMLTTLLVSSVAAVEPAKEVSKSIHGFDVGEIISREPLLTAEDTRKIEAGEILVRDLPQGLLGGLSIAWIQAPVDAVFATVTDYPHYVEFMPDAMVVNVLQEGGNFARVSAKYRSTWPFAPIELESTNLYDDSLPFQKRMAWKATKTNMKMAYGYWIIKPYKTGSLVFYEMGFDLNWIPHSIARPSGRKRVVGVMEAVRNRTTQTASLQVGE